MAEMTVNQFRANLKNAVDSALTIHEPLVVRRRAGKDFVVIGAEDWEREQETLFILQNQSLMKQVIKSLKTHQEATGYRPSQEKLDALDRF
ncbi:MAG: prevent-host-death protein [Candidatus Marinimicrobia bacterium CG08_land_8_20_14_0_20_45_22]|nr:MAG: prevent-host-death protein [Candidatus Marinimicrobia bacterium CG08_land_8_20_14_0_20_45_22]